MDAGIEVGALHTPLQLAHQRAVDSVAARGAIERQPGHPVGHLVGDRPHTGSARSTIAPASVPAGSVP